MRDFIILEIQGRAQAKGRPRFSSSGHAYTDARTRAAERMLQFAMREVCSKPLEGPLELGVTFKFRRPNSWAKARKAAVDESGDEPWFVGKPDVDNLLKTIMDAAKGILWGDDSQVVKVEACKVYSSDPGTVVNLFPASNP